MLAGFQAYQQYAQNQGTLIPGQLLTVNKHSVQVERYLAQGGFAHVYLVTTATPIHNTTRHVLKRIAVANEAMLAEVKKEVDIMRLLKGHPNIVHFIDAAWHRTPNGLFEVFILMEFCPGGGLIDMMNRRLRERLTEAEILQIFVDVCEGVAAMHNLRPPLLHRDLKVENILQATSTSFKLCDFGSSTTIAPRPPATAQEIRALEADLNRHTTLQYRAPEMVDPYLRRPVDEKSDVWALGVLLYKLCYYTTPFEEHGPLAILNVQYRIPPYPVYSAQINDLIASILREHSAQRPTVFELLATVHGMRGTKSAFTYLTPTVPSFPSRLPEPATQTKPPKTLHRQASGSSPTKSPSKRIPSAGIQARENVLEAISPMRRGRPVSSQLKELPSRPQSRPSSPQKSSNGNQLAIPPVSDGIRAAWLDKSFSTEDEKAWQNVINLKSGADTQIKRDEGLNDAWTLKEGAATSKSIPTIQTLDDDFQTKLWNLTPAIPIDNSLKPTTTKYRPPAFTGSEPARSSKVGVTKVKAKDAFGDLGLGSQILPPAPTLGEARRLRTGLATMTANTRGQKPDIKADQGKLGILSNGPSPSPRPSHPSRSPSIFQSSSASHSPSPLKPSNQPSGHAASSVPDGLPVESRFPSLEELDASFSKKYPSIVDGELKSQSVGGLLQRPLPPRNRIASGETTRPSIPPSSYVRDQSGVKEAKFTASVGGNRTAVEPIHDATQNQPSRPPLVRKHRSTHSLQTPTTQTTFHSASTTSSASKLELPGHSIPSSRLPVMEQKDWLTGDDNDFMSRPPTLPAFQPSPVPNVQSTERAPDIATPSTAAPASLLQISAFNAPSTPSASTLTFSRVLPSISKPLVLDQPIGPSQRRSPDKSPKLNSNARVLEPTSVTESSSSKDLQVRSIPSRTTSKDSSSDDGPEDVSGYTASVAHQDVKQRVQTKRSHKGRQSSVHDLVDLWGGSALASTSSPTSGFKANVNVQTRSGNIAPLTASTKASTRPPPRSTSPLPILSAPPDIRDSSRPSKPSILDTEHTRKHPSSPGSLKSPVSARSRPQSMFLFPVSKSTSDGASPTSTDGSFSAGLAPPGGTQTRTRRTSISDMVQMYESIGGRSNALGPPSAVLARATALKATLGENSSKALPSASLAPKDDNDLDSRVGSSLTLPADSRNNVGFDNSYSSPTRTANASESRSSIASRRDTPLSKGLDNAMPQKLRPFDSSSPSGSTALNLSDVRLTSRKPMEDTPKAAEERPPSPDQSYQGVGKLIAQWQRKSEEAESGRNPPSPRRGGPVGKRTAFISDKTIEKGR